jgi:hypothetical protein
MKIKNFPKYINNFFLFFLRNIFILYIYGLARFYILKKFYGIKVMESKENIAISNYHNLKVFKNKNIANDFLMKRFDRLLYSVLANERFHEDSNILVIGNRTEADLLKIKSFGYRNIKAIDLISYSPLVTLMDAHNITFSDDSFDIVFLPYVLPYSKNPALMAKNIIKVVKPGGIVAVAIEYDLSNKIKSVDDIKSIFEPHIKNVNFIYDAELKSLSSNNITLINGLGASSVIVSFTVKK